MTGLVVILALWLVALGLRRLLVDHQPEAAEQPPGPPREMPDAVPPARDGAQFLRGAFVFEPGTPPRLVLVCANEAVREATARVAFGGFQLQAVRADGPPLDPPKISRAVMDQ